MLAEQSVGRMVLAGVGPGLLLSPVFLLTILLLAVTRRSFVFDTERGDAPFEDIGLVVILRKAIPILALMIVVLGGLYGGVLNPTEAGAFGALMIALLRRSLDGSTFCRLLVDTGQITVSALVVIIFFPSIATWLARMS